MLALIAPFSVFADLDEPFSPQVEGLVSTIAAQPDGKILIGGNFSSVNGTPRNFLARLNADGSLDASFPASNGPSEFVSRVLVANSKIYVSAGDGIRRYDFSGTLEWHYPMAVATVAVDSQQRVILGGQFTRVENQPHRNIARLSAAGVLDSSFTATIGCCAGEGVFALATTGDAILVGGGFQSVNGSSVDGNFTRLNADGSLDANFSAVADPFVLGIAPTADGKVFRTSEHTVARHLGTGANDPSFAPLAADGSSVERFTTMAAQSDGKIIVAGSPTFLVRFNSDGSQDSSFSLQPDGLVQGIAVQSSGDVLIAGSFTHVNGQPRSGVARWKSAEATLAVQLSVAHGLNGTLVLSWPTNSGDFALQSCALSVNTWCSNSNAPILIGDRNWVTNAALGAGGLFRLVRRP